jgi:hypothetical protein
MGDRSYLRHGYHLCTERVVEVSKPIYPRSQVMKVTTRMPSSTSFNASHLVCQDGGDVDLLPVHADADASGDEDVAVVEG